jgi:hypothetical protein
MNAFKTNQFNNNINKIIGEFINDVEKFNEIINKNNIILSGSSVLKAINDDNYDIKDLDLYINSSLQLSEDAFNSDSIRNAISDICPELYKFIELNTDYEISKLMVSSENKIMNDLYRGMRSINYVFTLHNNKNSKTIELIICDNYMDTIKEFDLSINKNYWDGKNVTITDPRSVFTKHEKLSLHIKSKLDYYTLERIEKYRKRGYNIELTELTSLLPKSIYNSEDLVKIISDTFGKFVFESL